MFKQPVLSISISLLAILALQCGNAAEKKAGRDPKAVGQFDVVKEAWAQMETAYQSRGKVFSNFFNTTLTRDSILFAIILDEVNEDLQKTEKLSLFQNNIEITEINVKKYLQQHKTFAASFTRWLRQAEGKADQSLLPALQSSLEEAELNILRARGKYETAVEAYNIAESDRSKHLPTDPFKYITH
jgi:hypothetical protein